MAGRRWGLRGAAATTVSRAPRRAPITRLMVGPSAVIRSKASAWPGASLVLAACMLLPVSARGQDGGSRSVFAEGVGNRAVAMGGAFSALSDDASGLLWNPGGLGRVQRLQFEAGQSSYFGPGTGESYLLAAMPNWRWGVIGLSLRHYGVQDIDQRDDRNFVVAGPTSDSQTEVTLGYGRGLGSFLSLGGALRARHQSLAGY